MPTTRKEIDDLIARVKALRDHAMDYAGTSDENTLKNNGEPLAWASNEYELILEEIPHLRVDPLPPSEILDANATPPERADWARVQFRNIHRWCNHAVDELEAVRFNLPDDPPANRTEKVGDKKAEEGFFARLLNGLFWLLGWIFWLITWPFRKLWGLLWSLSILTLFGIALLAFVLAAGYWWWSNPSEDGATDKPVTEAAAVNPEDRSFNCAYAQMQTGDFYGDNGRMEFTVIPLSSGAALYVLGVEHADRSAECTVGGGTALSARGMRGIRKALSTSDMQMPDDENIQITPPVTIAPWKNEGTRFVVRCNLGPAKDISACWGE